MEGGFLDTTGKDCGCASSKFWRQRKRDQRCWQIGPVKSTHCPGQPGGSSVSVSGRYHWQGISECNEM